MANLYLLHYNNYANGKIKYPRELDYYTHFLLGDVITNVNFNPNDGINTSQIVNWDNEDPDYVIVTTTDGATETIASRWFVIHTTRLRNGQYELELRRDTIADNWDAVQEASAYVEKGWVPQTSTLFYNSENFQGNQIKISQEAIKDTSDACKWGPWYVAYLPRSETKVGGKGKIRNKQNFNFIDMSRAQFESSMVNRFGNGTYGELPEANDIGFYAVGATSVSASAVNSRYMTVTYDYTTGKYKFNAASLGSTANFWGGVRYMSNKGFSNIEGKSDDFVDTAARAVRQAFLNGSDTLTGTSYIKSAYGPMSNNQAWMYEAQTNYTDLIEHAFFEDMNKYAAAGVVIRVKNDNNSYSYYRLKHAVNNYSDTSFSTSNQASTIRSQRSNVNRIMLTHYEFNHKFYGLASSSTTTVPPDKNNQIANTGDSYLSANTSTSALTNSWYTNFSDVADDNGVKYADYYNLSISNYFKDVSTSISLPFCLGILFNSFNIHTYTLQEIPFIASTYLGEYEYNFGYDIAVTKDSPYEIVAAPKNNIYAKKIGGIWKYLQNVAPDSSWTLIHDGDLAGVWFQELAIGGIRYYDADDPDNLNTQERKKAYDVQIVPYVNVSNIFTNPDDNGLPTNYAPGFLNNGTRNVAFALKLNESSSSFQINFKVSTANLNNDPYEAKAIDNLYLYRLRSPGGASFYDFSVVKNGGINNFIVDYTLLPFNPYFNISPVFGNLYGQSFSKDYRGLILHDDFSLPILTDAWEEYLMNNKNYQAMFDRQLESMDLKHKYDEIDKTIGAVTGTIGGGMAGAMTGAKYGGGYGAIAGAVVGTGAGLAKGIYDINKTNALYEDARGAAIDQFNWNLENIQARQQGLTRTTGYNIDNSYFPVLEIYRATLEEKDIFINLIKTTGFTVKALGTISQYSNRPAEVAGEPTYTFVRAKIYDIDINEDAHYVQDINNQFAVGVRLETQTGD